jgi:TolB-like protein/DNA-binding winged helix-turn-helix (wHTH) protein/Tfp pilus assembly protein PilF
VKESLLASAGMAHFGAFEFNLKTGELRKGGTPIKLPAQSAEILIALLERGADLVTRENLRLRLWPADTFVDFDHGLNNAINRLREALNDSADAPRFIETLPRRGYRFIAPVETSPAVTPVASIHSSSAQQPIAPPGPPMAAEVPGEDRGHTALQKLWVAAAVFAAVISLLIGTNIRGWRDRLLAKSRSAPIQSIAVLPLENLSGDPSQEYFADGMTDALITDLAQVRALRVISRTSIMQYKSKSTFKSLPVIARELGVDAVVEGTVTRSGDRVRIDAQLIEAKSDRHLWARQFEGDLRDILVLQGQVARAITREIQAQLTPHEEERLAAGRPISPKAYELYLKGQFYLSRRTETSMRKSLDYFQEAVQTDPNWAPAYAGMADAYDLLTNSGVEPPHSIFKAKAAAMKALELDPSMAEAQTTLGSVADSDWEFAEAERFYKEAIALKPGYATAHHWYARHLATLGRQEEALIEISKARELDPLSLIIIDNVGEIRSWYGEYDQAIQEYQKALELDPNFWRAHLDLGVAYEQKRMFSEAVAELVKARTLAGVDQAKVAALQQAYSERGWRGFCQKQLEQRKTPSGRRYVSPYLIARASARAGDLDQTFAWLEKAFKEHSPWMVQLKVDEAFVPMRSDLRFQSLLRRVGLPR